MNAPSTSAVLVSVILPAHNREELLTRSIESVLNQTFSDFELIVVDDGSTDGTDEVIARLEDPRVRYVRLEKNRGASAARNVGIRQANGRFLAFQDSDDEWVPEKLEKQLQCLERQDKEVGVVYSDMERIEADGSVLYYRSPTVIPDRLINADMGFYQVYGLGIQSTLIRRECFDHVRTFDERYRCFEDLELFIRLSKHYRFHHLQEPLVRYYETVGVSSDAYAEYNARAFLLRTHARTVGRTHPGFLIREGVAVSWGRCFERAKQTAVARFLRLRYKHWRYRLRSRFKAPGKP